MAVATLTSKADFADCLIGRINHANGCADTATFDRQAGRPRHIFPFKWPLSSGCTLTIIHHLTSTQYVAATRLW